MFWITIGPFEFDFFSFRLLRCIMQFFIRKINITSLDYRTLYALDLVVSLSCLMHQKCYDPSGLGCLEKLEIDISWRIRDLVLHSAGRSESPDLLEPISAKKKQIRNLLPLYYSLLDRFHSLSIKWLLKALEMSDMKCFWFINGVCCRLIVGSFVFPWICISIIIIKCTALQTYTYITIGIAS